MRSPNFHRFRLRKRGLKATNEGVLVARIGCTNVRADTLTNKKTLSVNHTNRYRKAFDFNGFRSSRSGGRTRTARKGHRILSQEDNAENPGKTKVSEVGAARGAAVETELDSRVAKLAELWERLGTDKRSGLLTMLDGITTMFERQS